MLEALLFGVLIGTLSGLTPGIHSNTLAALLLSISSILPFNTQELAVVFISSAITHTFLDFIPSSFIGVPDEDMAVAVLPAHEMVLEGRGIEAASISALSSFLAVVASIPAFIFLNYLDYSFIEKMVVPVVLFFSTYLIFNERDVFGGSLASWRKRFYSLLVFLTSGFIGFSAMTLPVSEKPGATMLLPLLTGLFAVPVLVASLSGKSIPEQKPAIKLPETSYVLRGAISGFTVSLFPGISSGVAAAVSSADARRAEEYIQHCKRIPLPRCAGLFWKSEERCGERNQRNRLSAGNI
jgi:putative membrane protein